MASDTNVLAGDCGARRGHGSRIDSAPSPTAACPLPMPPGPPGSSRGCDVTDAGRAETIPAAVDLVDLVSMPVVDAAVAALVRRLAGTPGPRSG
ncbi:MAG: hypothetical protein U0U69_02170 [Acidimicrobiia bacterium]